MVYGPFHLNNIQHKGLEDRRSAKISQQKLFVIDLGLLNKHLVFALLRLCAILFLVYQSGATTQALDLSKFITQYKQNVWSVEHGLPQNSVRAILQTHDGYLWIGTKDGLARFDGVSFTTFNKQNAKEFTSTNIASLFEDRDKGLWIGTMGGGVIRYKDGKFTLYTVDDGLPENSGLSIYEDNEGGIWIGTWRGAARYKDGKFTKYSTINTLANYIVRAVCGTKSGTVWFGTWNGVSQLNNGKITTYTTKHGLASERITEIYVDRHDSVWVGTDDGYLHRFINGRFTSYTSKLLLGKAISVIYMDSQDNLWIGSHGGGINRFKEGTFDSYTSNEGLPNDAIDAIYEDREGSLWIGTSGAGLVRFKEGIFTTYTKREGLSDDYVWSVLESRDGSIWMGTGSGGLNRYKDGKFTLYTMDNGLLSNSVYTLLEGRDGSLWIGSNAPALTRYKDGQFTHYTSKDGFPSGVDSVSLLFEAKDGAIWFSSYGGSLGVYQNNRFTNYTTTNGLSNNNTYAIWGDHEGAVLIGTFGGLDKFKDGQFTRIALHDWQFGHVVASIHEDAENTLWFGSLGSGVNRIINGKISTYSSRDGLPTDDVYNILEDMKGNLWFSTPKGVLQINKKEFDRFDRREISSLNFTSFGEAEGMLSSGCIDAGSASATKSRNGKMLFATYKGVAIVDPHNIQLNKLAPPVYIEKVEVNKKIIDISNYIELPAGSNDISFHYTALSLLAPEKVKFKYILEGFDKEWHEERSLRMVNYTNVPSGYYKFKVIAANNDGIWNDKGAMFDFYINPYFYQTYYFYALCLLIVSAIVWGLHRYRLKEMKMRLAGVMAERNRVAQELHDTLFQSMAGLAFDLEAVLNKLDDSPETSRAQLERSLINIGSILTEARRSIWDLRSKVLVGTDFPVALSKFSEELTANRPERVNIKFKGKSRPLPKLVEQNLFRIYQESITNAVKHAQANRINVEFYFKPKSVMLRVKDDGCGFDPSSYNMTNEDHFGLLGIHERVNKINGKLILNSIIGQGTEIIVEIPTNNN
jgi:ligand-binding sensor domain-containing protein/signal transduction histidine kinase